MVRKNPVRTRAWIAGNAHAQGRAPREQGRITIRVPEELQPLTDAFNSMLMRMQRNMDGQRRFISDAAH